MFPGDGPQEGRGGMREQVLAEDVRTAVRRCAAERATRRGCADSPGRPGGGRPGCAAAGDQLLVSCGPVKRSIWACCRASASSASEAARSEIWATRPSSSSISVRSEEHTSELQSLMRISYAVFCLKKKTKKNEPLKEQ